jgi:hypothetical protein
MTGTVRRDVIVVEGMDGGHGSSLRMERRTLNTGSMVSWD